MPALTHRSFEATAVRECLIRHFKTEPALAKEFLHITDLKMATSHLHQIVALNDFVALDTEHYKISADVSEKCLFPLVTNCWQRRGPFVATVQLSTTVQNYVFDIVAMRQLPQLLAALFESDKIVKVVFDHKAEAQVISNSFSLSLNNVIDIQSLLMDIDCKPILGVTLSPKPPTSSLLNVAHTFLGIALDKAAKHRTWLEEILSAEMLQYAADDSAILIRFLQFIATMWWLRLVSEKGEKQTPPLSIDTVPYLVSLLARFYSSDKKAKLYNDPGPFPVHLLYSPRTVQLPEMLYQMDQPQ